MPEPAGKASSQQPRSLQVRKEHPDAVVARLAEAQWGVVARRQLRAAGLTAAQIAHRVQAERLIRLYHGVYAAGHRHLQPEGRRLAAVLACGPGAVLSFRSAAGHWQLRANRRTRIEVTAPRGRKGPAGVQVHTARLGRDDVTILDGIPITTVARTLVDLAAVVSERAVADAIDEAHCRDVYDHRAVEAQRRRGRPGAAALGRVLARRHPERHRAKSPLETDGIDAFAASGLPMPEINAWIRDGTFEVEVDLLWRSDALVVELDGWEFHRSRDAFENDRQKQVELEARGYAVMRFTWRQLQRRPEWVAGHVRARRERTRLRHANLQG